MACRECLESFLKVLNLLLTVTGLAMIGYGVFLLVEWKRASSPAAGGGQAFTPVGDQRELLSLGRPMLLVISWSTSINDVLPKAWFIYSLIGVGIIILIISCFGCIGIATRRNCCLSCYSFLLISLVLVELAAASFIFFDPSWKDAIPSDKTGDFDKIYKFLQDNWRIAKWVALGVINLEALAFLLAVILRGANMTEEYDSDDEYIMPRSEVRQPFINKQAIQASGVPTLEHRPIRNDAWSQRMREKYGLDTTELGSKASDLSRSHQAIPTPADDRASCVIL